MDINELIQNNPSINLTVTGEDLREYGEGIAKQAAQAVLQGNEDIPRTAKYVEEKFGVCPATRWRWDKLGILKPKRIGGRIFYSDSDIQELLEKRGG